MAAVDRQTERLELGAPDGRSLGEPPPLGELGERGPIVAAADSLKLVVAGRVGVARGPHRHLDARVEDVVSAGRDRLRSHRGRAGRAAGVG